METFRVLHSTLETLLLDLSGKRTWLSTKSLRVRIPSGAFGFPTSDLRIKYCAVRQRLERPVSETGVCEFESHPYNLALSRFGASHVLVRGKQPGLAVHEGKTELE